MNLLAWAFPRPIPCAAEKVMDNGQQSTLLYKRSHFVTQLPVDCLYTASHAWLAHTEGGCWRVGLTKFATRMLGEMVDHGFSAEPGASVHPGDIIGWVEGFKAISDLFCVVEGEFKGTNSALKEKIALITRDPYGAGWLYEVKGQPDAKCMDVHAYRSLLDRTIDRLLAQQQAGETH
jgi:glycine cleavage system H protein